MPLDFLKVGVVSRDVVDNPAPLLDKLTGMSSDLCVFVFSSRHLHDHLPQI
jgi:hypothetical protein